jgi:ATP-dependent RNA helicase DDX10/DBP4
MGFQRTLTALLDHLPKSRQTLLFSATQTQSVADLARLSLKDPAQIGIEVSPLSQSFLPQKLEQHYLLVELDKKLDVLWSFIKTHLQSKIIVFMSSCNQVRFVFETFCKMHPGVSLLQLQGKQKQSARLTMYQRFTTTSHAVLFATDIAARGLDFPSVDWVVQLDAPEDADTYIHRVGRTARYESKGKGLLFLLPSEEEGMKAGLQLKGIEVSKIKNRPSKTQNIQNQLQNLCFQDPEIKHLGQRVWFVFLFSPGCNIAYIHDARSQAFVSYMRSVYLHKDKSVFKIEELPADLFAESLGLPGTPKIKFFSREMAKQKRKKNESRTVEEEEEEQPGNGTVRTKYDRMFERKNQNVLSSHYSKLIEHDEPPTSNDDDKSDDDDEFITLKRADHDLPDESSKMLPPLDSSSDLSKRKLKLGKAKQAIAKNGIAKKLVFDDAGKSHEIYEMADPDAWYEAKGGLVGAKKEGQLFAQQEGLKMRVADVADKQEARNKKRDKKRKRKEKEKEKSVRLLFPCSFEGGLVYSRRFSFSACRW